MQVFELIVKTNKPQLLDRAMQHFGCAVVEGTAHPCRLRCFNADPKFIKFAIENQGYGTVLSGPEIRVDA